MANPYESAGNTDPFREHSSPVGESAHPEPGFYQPPGVGSPTTPPSLYGGSGPGLTEKEIPSQFYDGPSSTSARAIPSGAQATAEADAQPPPPEESRASRFWTLEFYQQFFDVNTRQVLLRLSNTLVPLNPPDFLMDRNWHYSGGVEPQSQAALEEAGVTLSKKPDLYGPFWVCTTLWITLGIVGNIMGSIAHRKSGDRTSKWKYDFSIASVASVVVYLYCFAFGSAVWGIMHWKHIPISLTDTICLYGYSMFIFVLVAILCMIPVSAVQWVLVLLGGAWSTLYLLANFWRIWKVSLEPKWFVYIVALVSVFHMLLTLSFKFYFFHYKI